MFVWFNLPVQNRVVKRTWLSAYTNHAHMVVTSMRVRGHSERHRSEAVSTSPGCAANGHTDQAPMQPLQAGLDPIGRDGPVPKHKPS